MNKLTTPQILCIVSVVDLIFGSHGGVTLLLWLGYAIYKS